MLRKILLSCGIVAMLWYVAVNIIVPAQNPQYDMASQTISELSAIGAPTRLLWVQLCIAYSILLLLFGVGIWLTAGDNRKLKTAGAIVMADAAWGFYWPPMHQREVIAAGGETLTDTLHLAWGFVHLAFMLWLIVIGASLYGKKFRLFSIFIVLVFIVFGALTGIESKGIQLGEPTPYIGIWERINIAAYMLWIIVFAIKLLSRSITTN